MENKIKKTKENLAKKYNITYKQLLNEFEFGVGIYEKITLDELFSEIIIIFNKLNK